MTLLQDPPTRSGRVPSGDVAGPAGPGGPGGPVRPSVLRFTDSLDRALESLVDAPTWSMSDDQLGEALVALTRERARLQELSGRVLLEAHARKVGHAQGATSTARCAAARKRYTHSWASLRVSQNTRGTLGHVTWHSARPSATTAGRTRSSRKTDEYRSSTTTAARGSAARSASWYFSFPVVSDETRSCRLLRSTEATSCPSCTIP